HLNVAAARAELDRVREQIPHDLLEAIGIAMNDGCEIEMFFDGDLLRRRRGPQRLNRIRDDGAQIDRSYSQPELAADDAGDIEDIFDEPRLRLRGTVDRLQGQLRRLLVGD